jgi:molybdopterin/thiamine biosynthesis adenylyltransferase
MDHTRHIGIYDARNVILTLIGTGGIGAMTAVALAKMGIGKLILYDSDLVEEINLPVQFLKISDIGKAKVIAVERAVLEYADSIAVEHRFQKVVSGTQLQPSHITISAVDSIGARKEIWASVKHQNPLWYIDARMSAEHFQMYAVELDHYSWYEASLEVQDDRLIPDEPCTSKATIYTACTAAGHIGAAVRRIITGCQRPEILNHDIVGEILTHLSMN